MNEKNDNAKTSFSAVVMFVDDDTECTFDVEIDKDIKDLTYDEVEAVIWDAVDNEYGYSPDDFEDDNVPYRIVDIVVNDNGESYPVVSEDADTSAIEKSGYTKYLVLPWATYTLTPECSLWMKMKEDGIVSEDEPFDYEKYHSLVEVVNEKK